MTRRLLNLLTALSLLLCVAVCGLWLRSYRHQDALPYHRAGELWRILSAGGRVGFDNEPQRQIERQLAAAELAKWEAEIRAVALRWQADRDQDRQTRAVMRRWLAELSGQPPPSAGAGTEAQHQDVVELRRAMESLEWECKQVVPGPRLTVNQPAVRGLALSMSTPNQAASLGPGSFAPVARLRVAPRRSWSVRYTTLASVLAAPAAVWLSLFVSRWPARRRQRLIDRGLCPSCGYDLRATPGRCPECGGQVTPPTAYNSRRFAVDRPGAEAP